jgi:hypothetical protein
VRLRCSREESKEVRAIAMSSKQRRNRASSAFRPSLIPALHTPVTLSSKGSPVGGMSRTVSDVVRATLSRVEGDRANIFPWSPLPLKRQGSNCAD